MISKDRLIVIAVALPAVAGFGLAIAVTRDLLLAGGVGIACSLIAAGLSLTPPVKAARLRLLRRNYPTSE
jgi:hypothetical protein